LVEGVIQPGRENWIMPAPKKYDAETQQRAVRMYLDRLSEGDDISKLTARREVGELLGVNESTLRNWVRRDVGEGSAPTAGSSDAAAEELARLRRENAQLRKANEILKTASAFFAQAELDRKLGW
jgi:transposase